MQSSLLAKGLDFVIRQVGVGASPYYIAESNIYACNCLKLAFSICFLHRWLEGCLAAWEPGLVFIFALIVLPSACI